ncbi:hypothetical protein PIB30_093557 [Stylosanthes scabra]|uniref:Uncharacterized protein n=1 Tax=Stylosanthes scabra TaxID=79078 RepID=A0ABU6TUK3_9FABA|nr:hypothetical protein [Stylosanthes scabra]
MSELEAVFLYNLGADSRRLGKSRIATCSGSPTEGSCICWCGCLTMSTWAASQLASRLRRHQSELLNPQRWKRKRPWVIQRRMIWTMLRALLHPLTLRRAVRALRNPVSYLSSLYPSGTASNSKGGGRAMLFSAA